MSDFSLPKPGGAGLVSSLVDGNYDPVVDQIFPSATNSKPRLVFGVNFLPLGASRVVSRRTLSDTLDYLHREMIDYCVDLVAYPFGDGEIPSVGSIHTRTTIRTPSRLLRTSDWSALYVGSLSPSLFTPESLSPANFSRTEKLFLEEYGWAFHLSLPAVFVPFPKNKATLLAFARLINSALCSSYARVPIWVGIHHLGSESQSEEMQSESESESVGVEDESDDPFLLWRKLVRIVDYSEFLCCVLRVGVGMKGVDLFRWVGTNCVAIELGVGTGVPDSVFGTKRMKVVGKRFVEVEEEQEDQDTLVKKQTASFVPGIEQMVRLPCVLEKDIRQFIGTMSCTFGAQIIFRIEQRVQPSAAATDEGSYGYMEGLSAYRDAICDIAREMPTQTAVDQFVAPFRDVLQVPLQPLGRNLVDATYECFERDPVKYRLYEEAITKALADRDKGDGTKQVVMVLGAGRGPLVKATFRAARETGVPVRVYAVEKNPNAFVVLTSMMNTIWADEDFTLVKHDIRFWDAPEKADLVISELLGSWGDNELSPECLAPIPRIMKEDAVCIPCDSTSYIVPAMSDKIFAAVRKLAGDYSETASVVNVHRVFRLDHPQPVFKFVYPEPVDSPTLERSNGVKFTSNANAVLHGFIGYFESTLYKDKYLSTLPETATPHMFSWFPMWFPILNPIDVGAGEDIDIFFWRTQNEKMVWYEWCIDTPGGTTRVYNTNGASYHINK